MDPDYLIAIGVGFVVTLGFGTPIWIVLNLLGGP